MRKLLKKWLRKRGKDPDPSLPLNDPSSCHAVKQASASRALPRVSLTKNKKLRTTYDSLTFGLGLLAESAAACPPLESAVCGLKHIVQQSQKFHENNEELDDFLLKIEHFSYELERLIPDPEKVTLDLGLTEAIQVFDHEIIIIGSKLEKLANRPRFRRWLTANDFKKTLHTCKEDFKMAESKLLIKLHLVSVIRVTDKTMYHTKKERIMLILFLSIPFFPLDPSYIA